MTGVSRGCGGLLLPARREQLRRQAALRVPAGAARRAPDRGREVGGVGAAPSWHERRRRRPGCGSLGRAWGQGCRDGSRSRLAAHDAATPAHTRGPAPSRARARARSEPLSWLKPGGSDRDHRPRYAVRCSRHRGYTISALRSD